MKKEKEISKAIVELGNGKISWLLLPAVGAVSRAPERFDCATARCPHCFNRALAPLPPWELAKQPDDTTHVCVPALGGCNQGFAVDK